MKKEWLLLFVSVVITLLTVLGLVRWLAPQLLGIPVDLQLVRVDKKVPPFFENVFRLEDLSAEAIISDPLINRGKPFYPDNITYGPGDLLGFRNRHIPNVADIITIGDSQTYGNNVAIEQNWPNQLAAGLKNKQNTLYNMSVGAWGATQYFEIFQKAMWFQPLLIIVAFYTGNDPLDSFIRVYGDERWQDFRPNTELFKEDTPKAVYPDPQKVPESEFWRVFFNDGIIMTFTPKYRHIANMYNHSVVMAGYSIMEQLAEKMTFMARKFNVKLIFTIIPTKELVYAKKILSDNKTLRQDYRALVEDEQKNIRELAKNLAAIPGATYVDVVAPLQDAALGTRYLYSIAENGHPLEYGYSVIAKTLRPHANKLLPDKIEGPVLLVKGKLQDNEICIIKDNKLWYFSSLDHYKKNGWDKNNLKEIQRRDIENMSFAGTINEIDPERFGPNSTIFSGQEQ
jgi:lysophospholipase L1-like esterase